MAAVGGALACHATLTGVNADTVTLTEDGEELRIVNHHATEKLWAKFNGTTAVALEDENFIILPGQTQVFPGGFQNRPISIVGNGNVYSVEAV
jgi:hypothetical protein